MEFELLYMIQKLHTPFLDEVMKGITFLGESGWFWILLAVLDVYKRQALWNAQGTVQNIG